MPPPALRCTLSAPHQHLTLIGAQLVMAKHKGSAGCIPLTVPIAASPSFGALHLEQLDVVAAVAVYLGSNRGPMWGNRVQQGTA